MTISAASRRSTPSPPSFSAGPPGSNLVAFLKNPLTLFRKAGESDQPVVRVVIAPGNEIYLVTDPSLVPEVLIRRRHNFAKPRKLGDVTPALGMGLQTSDGYFHLRQRGLTEPAMSPPAVAVYASDIVDIATRAAERWPEGQEVDVHAECLRITFAVLGRALFGVPVEEQAPQIEAALETVLERCQRYSQPLGGVIDRIPLPSTKRLRRGQDQLEAFLDDRIRAIRNGSAGQGSVLAKMLAAKVPEDGATMTDAEARDEATILFLAGRETIGDVLAWTWYELVRHPEVEARLLTEIDTVLAGRAPTPDDLPNLPVLAKVVREGLRLYPVGWAILRQTLAEDTLGGFGIPAGSYILISPYVMHHDARNFPEPDEFRPDRWDNPEAVKDYSFIPFSAGPRSCVGEHFARLALPLLLATVVRRWQARLAPGPAIQAVPTFAIRPKGGMQMVLESRATNAASPA